MEFVSVRDLRVNTGNVWEKLEKEKDLIITSNGRPIALMTGIEGKNLELVLAAVRRARGEVAIRRMREAAQEKGSDRLSEKAVDEEIRRVRRDRHR